MKYIRKLGLVVIFLIIPLKTMEVQLANQINIEEQECYMSAIEAIECFMMGALEAAEAHNGVLISYYREPDQLATVSIEYYLKLIEIANDFDTNEFKEKEKNNYYSSAPYYVHYYDIQLSRLKEFLETKCVDREASKSLLEKVKGLKDQHGDAFLIEKFKSTDLTAITENIIFFANNRCNYISYFQARNSVGINILSNPSFLHFIFIPLAEYIGNH